MGFCLPIQIRLRTPDSGSRGQSYGFNTGLGCNVCFLDVLFQLEQLARHGVIAYWCLRVLLMCLMSYMRFHRGMVPTGKWAPRYRWENKTTN